MQSSEEDSDSRRSSSPTSPSKSGDKRGHEDVGGRQGEQRAAEQVERESSHSVTLEDIGPFDSAAFSAVVEVGLEPGSMPEDAPETGAEGRDDGRDGRDDGQDGRDEGRDEAAGRGGLSSASALTPVLMKDVLGGFVLFGNGSARFLTCCSCAGWLARLEEGTRAAIWGTRGSSTLTLPSLLCVAFDAFLGFCRDHCIPLGLPLTMPSSLPLGVKNGYTLFKQYVSLEFLLNCNCCVHFNLFSFVGSRLFHNMEFPRWPARKQPVHGHVHPVAGGLGRPWGGAE